MKKGMYVMYSVKARWMLALVLMILLLSAAVRADDPVRHDFPKVGSYEVITGDFHMHTVNSDGRMTTRQRVEESYQLGYDAIAVTDHGNPRSYRVAKYLGEQKGLIVLRGLEITLDTKEHLNVFGITPDFDTTNMKRLSTTRQEGMIFYQDAFKKVADNGGVVIYNHPHKGFNPPVEWGAQNGLLVGLEVKNEVVGKSWNTEQSHGTYWYPTAFDWAVKRNLTLFGNTDVHGKRSSQPPYTLLLVKERSARGVMEAIKSHRTAAWFDGMLTGYEPLLSNLISASVSVKRDSNGHITLENRCPITFKGSVEGTSFELGPYGQSTLDVPNAKDTITVSWTNVLTGSDKNLATAFSLK